MSIRTDPAAVDDETQGAPLNAWLPPLLGVAAAIVGLLPWLVTGMRLPLQNLWATETLPDRMPIVLLPFSQYALTLIAALLVTGATAAAIVARATRRRQPRGGIVAIFVGLLAAQVVAAAQTATVVRGGLDDRGASDLYFAAVLAVIVLAILVGVAVYWLVAVAPRAGALVGLTIAAILFGPWVNGLLVPFSTQPAEAVAAIIGLTRWVPAILVGVAIAWCGLGTVGRVIAAVSSLLLLWTGPALITGVTSAAGSRVLAGAPAEMLDQAARVTGMALFLPELALPPLVVTVVVAGAGLVGAALVRRRHRGEPAAAPADHAS
jgi:hypothetical protein